jgi:phosphoadenosine phosphosulfate reductase
MALIEETLFGTVDKVQIAIDRLKAFEPADGYWLAFSGGKDSVVIKRLAQMAGVKFEAHYSVTSVDPPELVRFIKDVHPDVSFDIPQDKNGKPITMWNLIPKKGMPPTRIARYCCKDLKESSGRGRVTLTGVRWAESNNRKNNQGSVTFTEKGIGRVISEYTENFTQTNRGGWCSIYTTTRRGALWRIATGQRKRWSIL